MLRRFGLWSVGGLMAVAVLPACSAVLGIKDLPGKDAGDGTGLEEDAGGSSGASSGAPDTGGNSPDASSGAADAGGRSPDAGGGGTPDASDPAAPFLGTWQLTGGMQILSSCTQVSDDMVYQEPTTIALVWVRGTKTDLFGTYTGQDSSGCTIAANVQNGVAVGVPGQTCTQFVSGGTDLITLVDATFTISGNTAQGVEHATDENEANGATCKLTDEATFTRE
jgi:hypothetical protein